MYGLTLSQRSREIWRTTGRRCGVDSATAIRGSILPVATAFAGTVGSIDTWEDMERIVDDDDVDAAVGAVRAVGMVVPGDMTMVVVMLPPLLCCTDWKAWMMDMNWEEDMDSRQAEGRMDSIRGSAGAGPVVVREAHSFAAYAAASGQSTMGCVRTGLRPGTLTSGRADNALLAA
jgi:hypothetical protein